jgi:VWFA-related protein
MLFNRVRQFGMAICFVMCCSVCLTAQAQNSPAPPPAQGQQQSQQPANEEPLQTFKAEVNVVNLFYNVKDKHGMLIPNLTKDDFSVFEDGKPQTIKYFSAESNQPLTLGIMIDTSASQTRVLTLEQEACATFLRQVLRQKDLAFVINFDTDVDLDQDFTNNVRDLTRALNKMQINAGMGGGPPGLGGGPIPTTPRGTLLYDAIFLAADEKLKNEVGRKAMIIFTDGEDQGSRLRSRDAIEAAQKADTICYVILIADRGFYGGFGYSGDYEMKKLAEQTGGRVIEVGNKPEKLHEAFEQIQNELRSQYSIGYSPTNNKQDGTYRKIQIRPKSNDYKVQARQGYYAMAKNN